ncbi:MAG: hypothetical protein OXL35_00005 [Chloroflexota bacterium]|nr:hypothetical protein [Chloroflexota bacterium]
MREHEVPTHVQAEDRVLLGFTFPQIVAITAVCALSYGAYRYAPVGPSEVRMAFAVLFGLAGIAMVVGKIGGRRLPLVAADLLKYRLGARVYAGPVAQLVRSEPPAPPQPAKSGPGLLRLMAKRSKRFLRRMRKKNRKGRDRRDGRMPFRPHTWFGKRRKRGERGQPPGHMAETLESRRRTPGRGGMAVVVALLVAMAATVPQAVLAQSPDDERWRDEIDFEIEEPVEGRRIFVEGLTISGDRAAVTLKAATDLEIRVRAFGGSEGRSLRFWGRATLAQGESVDYSLPLHGPVPSFTVSWEDTLGQAGAMTVDHDRIPYPLPEVQGELCTVRLKSLGWAPGAVHGVVESDCVESIEHPVELQTVSGHENVTQTALIDTGVTRITGAVNAVYAGTSAGVAFIPNGEMSFTLSVPDGEAVHDVSVYASVTADLSIPIPPLTVLTHHPQRSEDITETVSLYRPGASDSDYDSDTITVTHEDGTTTTHTVSAYAYAHVPSRTIQRDVTITIDHPEHVKAEVVEREPLTGSRDEALDLASYVGSDVPYAALTLPEPEPEDPPAEQTPAGGLREWFERLGWEWPW